MPRFTELSMELPDHIEAIPKASDFCKGHYTDPDNYSLHCTVGWMKELNLTTFSVHPTSSRKEDLRSFCPLPGVEAAWLKAADSVGIPNGDVSVITRNDRKATTKPKLARAFERMLVILGYDIHN